MGPVSLKSHENCVKGLKSQIKTLDTGLFCFQGKDFFCLKPRCCAIVRTPYLFVRKFSLRGLLQMETELMKIKGLFRFETNVRKTIK